MHPRLRGGLVQRGGRPRPRSRPHHHAATRRRRSPSGCAGPRRRTPRRATGSRRRRPRAAATKPGADATNPSTVSTRSMRSRLPSSARSTDKRVQRAPARRLGALLDREVEPQDAGMHERALVDRAAADPTCASARRGRRPRRADRAADTDPAARARAPRAVRRSLTATAPGTPDVSAPCQRWPPSNTSCTTASAGAPRCAYTRRKRLDGRRGRRRPGR